MLMSLVICILFYQKKWSKRGYATSVEIYVTGRLRVGDTKIYKYFCSVLYRLSHVCLCEQLLKKLEVPNLAGSIPPVCYTLIKGSKIWWHAYRPRKSLIYFVKSICIQYIKLIKISTYPHKLKSGNNTEVI